MMFDFDQIIDRSGTNAMAKGGFRNYLFADRADEIVLPCADDEAIPMWVADMAFASAPAAIDAMRQRLDHPIFGYSALLNDDLHGVFSSWCEERYGWTPEREHLCSSLGIVPALYDLVDQHVQAGQKVLTLTPAYGYFKHATKHHIRELVTCGLRLSPEGIYEIDFDELEAKVADPAVAMFFLCHPHNPTGRQWTEAELRRMADLCFANDVLVVSDEIHCDLLRSGLTHLPLAKLYPESDQIITCMSASKTFNLAGLGLAQLIISNDEHRALWDDRVAPVINPISEAGVIGAYRSGHKWLAELQGYLDTNFQLVYERLEADLPKASFTIPDATYLAWIGVDDYFPAGSDLTRHYAERSGVLVEGPDLFVSDAEGRIRVNVACPRSVLAAGIDRLIAATKA